MSKQTESDHGAPLWRQSFLTALPIVLTLAGGFFVNWYQGRVQHAERLAQEAAQAKKANDDRLAAEKTRQAEAKRMFEMQEHELSAQRIAQDRQLSEAAERQRRQNEADLILEVIKVGNLKVARSNIDFLLAAGLVRDPKGRITAAARDAPPVLPTASGSLVEVRDYREAGPLTLVDPERPGFDMSRGAARLLACAQTEFNRDIEERRSAARVAVYFQDLGLGDFSKRDASIFAWNAAFVSYCVRIAGLADRIKPSAQGIKILESAKRSGLAVDAVAPGFQFRRGDIYVLERASNAQLSQLGIVTTVKPGAIEGIEGNLADGVRLAIRPLPLDKLRGVIRASE